MTDLGMHRVLDEWATAWSSHDTDKVLSLFTDDCLYDDVTFGVVNRGKKELRAWVLTGTHHADFPGMPATGKRFSVRGATILELQGEKIRRNSDYWDAATVMRQVGLLP